MISTLNQVGKQDFSVEIVLLFNIQGVARYNQILIKSTAYFISGKFMKEIYIHRPSRDCHVQHLHDEIKIISFFYSQTSCMNERIILMYSHV